MEILLATNNEGKLKELQNILTTFTLKTLKEKNINIDIVEDQQTYEGNAIKKAVHIYNLTNLPTIADDSGLNIHVLNDFPGIETHRFAGLNATDTERNNIILNKIKNQDNRSAKFTTVLAYYDGYNTIIGKGILNGFIAKNISGTNGFGFDPIFEYAGKTLAQMTQEEKNKISARKLAAKDLLNNLRKVGIL